MPTSALSAIPQRFDRAAHAYDRAASVQAEVAQHLVTWATQSLYAPADILDLGSGTGFVAAMLHREWPQAAITAFDAAPAMLREAQRKIPKLQTVTGDATQINIPQKFDTIFSSMMLHWVPDPAATLRHWQTFLTPQGGLFIALPVAGSFQEWRDLCLTHGTADGLWTLPAANFAADLTARHETQDMRVIYESAHQFVRRIKDIGGSTSRVGHKPVNTGAMRRLLAHAPKPFVVTYRILYIEIQSASQN